MGKSRRGVLLSIEMNLANCEKKKSRGRVGSSTLREACESFIRSTCRASEEANNRLSGNQGKKGNVAKQNIHCERLRKRRCSNLDGGPGKAKEGLLKAGWASVVQSAQEPRYKARKPMKTKRNRR